MEQTPTKMRWKTREDLENMSIEHQLGYLQHLAGNVWLREDLPQDVRDEALDMEELGVHYYSRHFQGRCSLSASIAFDVEKAENEIIEKILYYQELLDG